MEKKEIKKVVFYSDGRTFRTILIGHLYEISQVYPVILLSEEVGRETKELLGDKKLFPKLEKVILVDQHSGSKKNILEKNRHLYNLAKNVINFYKPNIVMTSGDLYPFEMYLLRFAKRQKAVTFSVQSGNTLDIEVVRKKVDLTNAYLKFPSFLPLWFRLFLRFFGIS